MSFFGPDDPGYDEHPDDRAGRPFPTVNLAEVAKAGISEPVLLFNRLLYRGMLHSFAGPPDCGKSTLGYKAALEQLQAGEAVVVLDEEGGREVVAEKFLALGATPADLEQLAYVEFPSRSWDQADRAGLWQLLAAVRPTLVLVDSAGAFLAVAGQNENWAEHAIPFYKLLLAAAREHDCAVAVVDHVPKNEATGRYARGSGSKLQIVDVAYMVDAITPFSRHQNGLLKLHASKDRRGYLHRDHRVKVEVSDGHMTLTIAQVEVGTAEAGDDLPPAAVKVLSALRGKDQPQTIKELGDRMKRETGKSLTWPTIRKSLSLLADHDLADGEGEVGQAKRWWSLKTDEGGVP